MSLLNSLFKTLNLGIMNYRIVESLVLKPTNVQFTSDPRGHDNQIEDKIYALLH